MQDGTDTRNILSVSELNFELKHLIQGSFPLIWVEGEISNLARPASGHIYFSLKDDKANIRCVMFRTSGQKVNFKIENGIQLIARARVSLYEPRGDLQLVVEELEEAGFGALQKQFEQLKNKLFKEGLFEQDLKKPIPTYPKEVAIISSVSTAAIRDYLKVVTRRYPCLKKTVYSTPVQGETAAKHISAAINAANQHANACVIVLLRGGGSIEDLWPFNDEQLARTIVASSIPIVTGIGHEIDYTIADFVADLRAPTPSITAELTTPDRQTLETNLTNQQITLQRLCKENFEHKSQQLDWFSRRLQQTHPMTAIQVQSARLNALNHRLGLIREDLTKYAFTRVTYLNKQLLSHSPTMFIRQAKNEIRFRQSKLISSTRKRVDQYQHQFNILTSMLQAISPLGTLERGFSITLKQTDKAQPKLLRDSDETQSGDQLITYLGKGKVVSRVQSTSSENYIETVKPSIKSK